MNISNLERMTWLQDLTRYFQVQHVAVARLILPAYPHFQQQYIFPVEVILAEGEPLHLSAAKENRRW
jgi:hypothetical protein